MEVVWLLVTLAHQMACHDHPINLTALLAQRNRTTSIFFRPWKIRHRGFSLHTMKTYVCYRFIVPQIVFPCSWVALHYKCVPHNTQRDYIRELLYMEVGHGPKCIIIYYYIFYAIIKTIIIHVGV